MKRGMGLLSDGHPHSIRKALTCFDVARELRQQLPFETVPNLKYGLAACWLNRADALMRLEDATQIVHALQAYHEALALLRSLPLSEDSRFPRRLAIASQNYGLALFAQGGSAVPSAIVALTDAIAVLDLESAAPIADRRVLLAAAWTNLAKIRASERTVDSDLLALEAARRALALVAMLERSDVDAVEVGLKARHILCQALASHLLLGVGTMTEEVHDATDLVEDGLNLAREWEQEGVERFRSVADDLFWFGARVYQMYQPHFLADFLSEYSDRSG